MSPFLEIKDIRKFIFHSASRKKINLKCIIFRIMWKRNLPWRAQFTETYIFLNLQWIQCYCFNWIVGVGDAIGGILDCEMSIFFGNHSPLTLGENIYCMTTLSKLKSLLFCHWWLPRFENKVFNGWGKLLKFFTSCINDILLFFV